MSILTILVILFSIPAHSAIYTVKKNDSLWEISQKHKISVSDIRKLNDVYGEYVYENQKLFLPTGITEHKVQSGENFQSIAEKYNTQVKYIITLNNLSESQVIEGQTLRIPISEKPAPEASATTAPASTATAVSKPAAVSTQKVTYTVKRGDTLSDVALKYNTTVPKLQALNNKKSSQRRFFIILMN